TELNFLFFFFSSRRRHTRSKRDWSSDVCSSDLENYEQKGVDISIDGYPASPLQIVTAYMTKEEGTYMRDYILSRDGNIEALIFRSEERRVGKECKSWMWRARYKKQW